jgi:hypothetical protein
MLSCTFRVTHYNFTPKEVEVMYKLIVSMGWIDHQNEELVQLINRICKIVETNVMVSGPNKTT